MSSLTSRCPHHDPHHIKSQHNHHRHHPHHPHQCEQHPQTLRPLHYLHFTIKYLFFDIMMTIRSWQHNLQHPDKTAIQCGTNAVCEDHPNCESTFSVPLPSCPLYSWPLIPVSNIVSNLIDPQPKTDRFFAIVARPRIGATRLNRPSLAKVCSGNFLAEQR